MALAEQANQAEKGCSMTTARKHFPGPALTGAMILGLGLTLASAGPALAASPVRVQFNRDVRPILSNYCFQCHGPDQKQRKARLRLDSFQGAVKDSAVIVPHKSADSTLVERITEADPARRMPPKKFGKTLSPQQIATLKAWIDQGAEYQGHWAFIPPHRPELPKVTDALWARTAIDRFILARLEKEGLKPSPEADRRTLIRRVTFDLTGLPPTLAEVEAFVADPSPDAYEKVVDRLLASPHYGEHRARYWLDAVRYGDTHGLHLDNYREMWPYREWVIGAFNHNMPFDRFATEQLAGDLLPDATVAQRVASGYNRNHVTTSEGGSIAEEVYVRNVVDRVQTTGTVFLGLTIGCAVCHDHKFDPVTQKEFYQMFAFFNSMDGPPLDGNRKDPAPVIRVPTPEQQHRMADLQARIDAANRKLAERSRSVGPDFEDWLHKAEANVGKQAEVTAGLVAHYPLDEKSGPTTANLVKARPVGRVNGDPAWRPGKFGNAFEFDGKRHIDLGKVGAFERDRPFSYGAWINWAGGNQGMAPLSRMNDREAYRGYDIYLAGGQVMAHIIHHWPDNALKVTASGRIQPNRWTHVFVTYDGSSKASGIKIYLDGKSQTLSVNADSLKGTIQPSTGLRLGKRNPSSGFRGLVDEVRLYDRLLTADEVASLAGADPLAPILATPGPKRTKQQVEMLRSRYLESHDPEYRKLREEIARSQGQFKGLEGGEPTTLVMRETPTPKDAFVLIRGQYDKHGDKVTRGTPAFLPPLPKDAPLNRLGLARWLTEPNHPLTARVYVNRLWQQLFGVGIVKTAEDFGAQGEWPSHPELLDWLATRFVADGWDIKKALRRIVLSSTYRQSSRITPELVARDPENRLLARGPRFRLDAEMIRDQAMALSGLLVRKIGGPSVKPPQPRGLWEAVGYTSSNTARFKADTGLKLYRRSVYTFWKRTSPPPQMTTFDAPSRESCTVRRERTNTPLQALILMNERQFVECARDLAERIIKEGGPTIESRVAFAFRLATARPPSKEDAQDLTAAYRDFLARFKAEPESAKKLIAVGDTPPDPTLDPPELAAWTLVANVVLNLDEVLNKE
jgi:mono/diheme cytochrome c family protein